MEGIKRTVKDWVPSIVLAIIVSFSINTYVAQGMKVISGSMEPTIAISDRLFIEKVEPLSHYSFGDIVVFHPPVPGEEDERYVKRLIGLPGDKIEVRKGVLYRNDEPVQEDYVKEAMHYEYGPVVVPEDHYFFLGDNRNNSKDSHLWRDVQGKPTPFVDKREIIGKVMFRYFPMPGLVE